MVQALHLNKQFDTNTFYLTALIICYYLSLLSRLNRVIMIDGIETIKYSQYSLCVA